MTLLDSHTVLLAACLASANTTRARLHVTAATQQKKEKPMPA